MCLSVPFLIRTRTLSITDIVVVLSCHVVVVVVVVLLLLLLLLIIIIIIIIFSNPSARVGYDTRSIFKQSLTGLNSEFSFSLTSCLTKAEEPSLPYYLPIAGGIIIGFIPFPRVLVLCEMQSVSSIFIIIIHSFRVFSYQF